MFKREAGVKRRAISTMNRFHPYSPTGSSYSDRELENARASLVRDFEYSFQKSLLYHLQCNPVDSKDMHVPNIWEGETGMMEHVRQGFPMPQRQRSEHRGESVTKDCAPAASPTPQVSESESDKSPAHDSTVEIKPLQQNNSSESSDLVNALANPEELSAKMSTSNNEQSEGKEKEPERDCPSTSTKEQKDFKDMMQDEQFCLKLSQMKAMMNSLCIQMIKINKRLKEDPVYRSNAGRKALKKLRLRIISIRRKLLQVTPKRAKISSSMKLRKVFPERSRILSMLKSLQKQFQVCIEQQVPDMDPCCTMFGNILSAVEALFSEACLRPKQHLCTEGLSSGDHKPVLGFQVVNSDTPAGHSECKSEISHKNSHSGQKVVIEEKDSLKETDKLKELKSNDTVCIDHLNQSLSVDDESGSSVNNNSLGNSVSEAHSETNTINSQSEKGSFPNKEDLFWAKLSDLGKQVLRNMKNMKKVNKRCKICKSGPVRQSGYDLLVQIKNEIGDMSQQLCELRKEMISSPYVERGRFGLKHLKMPQLSRLKKNMSGVDIIDTLLKNLKASYVKTRRMAIPILEECQLLTSPEELTLTCSENNLEVVRMCAHSRFDAKNEHFEALTVPEDVLGMPTQKGVPANFIQEEKDHWQRLQALFLAIKKCNAKINTKVKLLQMDAQKRAEWTSKRGNPKTIQDLRTKMNELAKQLSAEASNSQMKGYCSTVFYTNLEMVSKNSQRNLVKSLQQIQHFLLVMQDKFENMKKLDEEKN